MLLLLHRPSKAVGTFRASPCYEQSCFFSKSHRAFVLNLFTLSSQSHLNWAEMKTDYNGLNGA